MPEEILAKLRESGAPVDNLSEAERAVFASLTPEEAEVVGSIQARLNEAAEVVGQRFTDENNTNVIC